MRYKKPKARGPNPLSVKKKIAKAPSRGSGTDGGGAAKKKRKRRGGGDKAS